MNIHEQTVYRNLNAPEYHIRWHGSQVPKLIHWKHQFAVSVHNKTNISNAEKTVYLKMRSRTELPRMRLSHSGDNAVECLKSRYLKSRYNRPRARPRIIQRTHVQDTPFLKEGRTQKTA